jgi:hypothetical protein
MDPNIGKPTDKKRTVGPYKESLPTSRGPHSKCFLRVQTEIRMYMTNDRQTFLTDSVEMYTCSNTALGRKKKK